MLSKTKITFIRSLSDRKFRYEHRLFVCEGIKLVEELVNSGLEINEIFYTEQTKIPFTALENSFQISGKEMERISSLKTPPGILALAKIPDYTTKLANSGLILVLDGISDPGNVGTIIRTGAWFGVQQTGFLPGCADPYNQKCIQASMGAIFRMTFCDVSIDMLKDHSLPKTGLVLKGDNIYESDIDSNNILITGSESHGISTPVLGICSQKVTIPGRGDTESLNAAIATGIALGEITRKAGSVH